MNKTIYMAALITMALSLPALAGGGGGGGGGRGGRGGGFGGGGGGGFGGGPGGGGYGPGGGGGGRYGTGGAGLIDQIGGALGVGGGRTAVGNPRGRNNVVLTDDFSVLDTTSIFAQNRVARDLNGEYNPTPTAPRPVVIQTSAPVFRGVVKDEKGYQAALEINTRDGMSMVYVRPGERLDWDGSAVADITMDSLTLTSNGRGGERKIPLGNNVENQTISVQPTVTTYQSLDSLPPQQIQQNYNNAGGRGRGRGRGGPNGGLNGGGLNGGYNGNYNTPGGIGVGGAGTVVIPAGGAGGFTTGGGVVGGFTPNANNYQGILVQPALDPPLPPGSLDSVESRMAQRRQQQLGGN